MVPKSIMRMKTVWTLLLLSLMVRVGYAAPKPLRAATRAEVNTFTKLYREGDAALLRRDLAHLSRIMTADFTAHFLSGKISNRAQVLRGADSLNRQVKFNASTHTIEKLNFRGKQAIVLVNGTNDFTARTFTARSRDIKVHRFYFSRRETDTWILTGRGWMRQSINVMAERLRLDGRFAR
jgi:hypothetical protein